MPRGRRVGRLTIDLPLPLTLVLADGRRRGGLVPSVPVHGGTVWGTAGAGHGEESSGLSPPVLSPVFSSSPASGQSSHSDQFLASLAPHFTSSCAWPQACISHFTLQSFPHLMPHARDLMPHARGLSRASRLTLHASTDSHSSPLPHAPTSRLTPHASHPPASRRAAGRRHVTPDRAAPCTRTPPPPTTVRSRAGAAAIVRP